jgi:hypothetical protein
MLQTSVRLQDSATTAQWPEEDWRTVQDRLVTYGTAQKRDPDSPVWRDRRTQAPTFWQFTDLYATRLQVPGTARGHLLVSGPVRPQRGAFEHSRQVALAHHSPLLTGLATRHLGLADCRAQPAAPAISAE